VSHPFRAILVASALLKLALALIFADVKPHYDEFEFLEFGRRVLAGQGPALWRAPGYQLFVAAGLALAGGRVVGVRVLEALVSCGTPFLTYRIGRERWGERAGLAAGAFTALAPSSVAFSHLLWSECLYTLLVVVAFALLLGAGKTGHSWRALGTGLVLGGAVLTRSVGFSLVAASIAWIFFAKEIRGRRLVLAGAVALGTRALVVAPYSLWASRRAGHLVVTDTNSGFNLWLGNDEYILPTCRRCGPSGSLSTTARAFRSPTADGRGSSPLACRPRESRLRSTTPGTAATRWTIWRATPRTRCCDCPRRPRRSGRPTSSCRDISCGTGTARSRRASSRSSCWLRGSPRPCRSCWAPAVSRCCRTTRFDRSPVHGSSHISRPIS
jgi:hypothetical protein